MRITQQAVGHNSKAVHHAYARHPEVTVPSLDDREESYWTGSFQTGKGGMQQQKLMAVNFQAAPAIGVESSPQAAAAR